MFEDLDRILRETLKIDSEVILPEKLEIKIKNRKSLSLSSVFTTSLTVILSATIFLFFICYDLIFETSFFSAIKENILLFLILVIANLFFEYHLKKYSKQIMKNNNVEFFSS